MSEADWSSEVGEELAAPPRRRIPGWVWGCGGGCLFVGLIAVVALFFVFRLVSRLSDQDLQWSRLNEVLPVEARPPGVKIWALPRLKGTATWFLIDMAHDQELVVMHSLPGPNATETRKSLLQDSGDVHIGGPFGGFGRNDVETGTVHVQGRDLRCLRYQSFPKDEQDGKPPLGVFGASLEGASIVLDLAPDSSDELLMGILTKMRTDERVSDKEVRAFLSAFRIPGGVPDAPEPPEEQPAAQPDAQPAGAGAGEGK